MIDKSTDIILYYDNDCSSLIVNALMRELGIDFQLRHISLRDGENLKDDYIEKNPFGLIPTLSDKGTYLHETGAICEYLSHTYNPSMIDNSAEFFRAKYIIINHLHRLSNFFFYTSDYGVCAENVEAVRKLMEDKIVHALNVLNENFFKDSVWLINDKPTFLDIYLGVICRWLTRFPKDYTPKNINWKEYPKIIRMLKELQQRPHIVAALLDEDINDLLI